MKKNNDLGLLILRLTLGILMVGYGFYKLTDLSGVAEIVEGNGLPKFVSYGVYLGELLAPILLIIGFRTRIAAFIYAINCLFIIGLAHSDEIFKLNNYWGWELELVGLYLFGAIVLFFTGGGKYALSKNNNWD